MFENLLRSGVIVRPMAAFVEAANRFPCTVAVSRPGQSPANGKRMMALMGLVATQGTELVIEVTGPDAAQALEALVLVFQRTYDEE